MAVDLKSPQQQVFDAVFLASYLLGYRTVDFLPPKDYTMPFVYVGEYFDQDRRTKDLLYGNMQLTLHIYHDYKKRRELTTMMDKLKVECRKLKQTENFYLTFKNITSRTLIDTSTGEPLLHGIIEVEFQFH